MTATGADETAVRVKGEKTVICAETDAATGEALGVDVLAERDSDGFMEWLGDFVSGFDVETMVTDALNTYKPVIERLGEEAGAEAYRQDRGGGTGSRRGYGGC